MSAPTQHQRRVLRLLAAGVHLCDPPAGSTRYRLTVGRAPAGTVQARTLDALVAAGWVLRHARDAHRWSLTDAGRGHALVPHAVADYAAALTTHRVTQ